MGESELITFVRSCRSAIQLYSDFGVVGKKERVLVGITQQWLSDALRK